MDEGRRAELARRLEELAEELRGAGATPRGGDGRGGAPAPVCRGCGAAVDGPAAEPLSGLAAIRAAYDEIQRDARRAIDAFDRGPHSAGPVGRSEAQPAALERGVRYRVVYDPRVFRREGLLDAVLRSARQGERARVSRLVPARLLLRDDEEFLIVRSAPDGGLAAVRGTTPWAACFLRGIFDSVWEAAMPLGGERLADWDLLNEEERGIVTLLAAGLTDEAIARQLGVSVRTVQRKVRSVQRSVGAASRFQLGALTAEGRREAP
ncbi:MAG: LuxR C-terminal-related transcriptional regulator [Pseudoclavibacter sp.]|nr:LuxR C-terminal-related transcriptional regulator [Pseudoclavibacter sp.]